MVKLERMAPAVTSGETMAQMCEKIALKNIAMRGKKKIGLLINNGKMWNHYYEKTYLCKL